MSPIQFTPAQARFIYLFKGLAPVATNIITPVMVMQGLKDKPLPPAKRQEIVLQEVARQVVSGVIGLVFYFGGGALTRKLVEKTVQKAGRKMTEAGRQIAILIGATCAEFIGYGFVRPLVSTELIVRWLQKYGFVEPEGKTGLQSPAPSWQPDASVPSGNRNLQTFMRNVETRSSNQFRGLA